MIHYFILGPSGVGKSYISTELAIQKNLLHLELDQLGQDGIDLYKLREPWDKFYKKHEPEDLKRALNTKATMDDKLGTVLSFSSVISLHTHIQCAKGCFQIIYLTGTPEQCLKSFLEREANENRGLTSQHWEDHNKTIFKILNKEECPKIQGFDSAGQRREFKEIIRDIERNSVRTYIQEGNLNKLFMGFVCPLYALAAYQNIAKLPNVKQGDIKILLFTNEAKTKNHHTVTIVGAKPIDYAGEYANIAELHETIKAQYGEVIHQMTTPEIIEQKWKTKLGIELYNKALRLATMHFEKYYSKGIRLYVTPTAT